MGEQLLSIEDVCKLLQLNQDQVTALVKKGQIRGFLDQKTYKFRAADVEKYRGRVEAGGTVVLDDGSKTDEISAREITEIQVPVEKDDKSDTSRIDLADIEGEAGADESDQTSVLAPVEDEDEVQAEPEPVFEFSEEDLGLSLDDDAAESVLIADESESSVDILETVDESSSESATSTTTLDLAEESSSGEDVVAVADIEETPPSDAMAPDTIMELDESSDEALETIDLDELDEVPDTDLADLVGETVEIGADDIAEAIDEVDTVETIPLDGEGETVGIEAEGDATRMTDEPLGVEALDDGTETVGVEPGAEDMAEAEEPPVGDSETELEDAPVVAGAWDLVIPWVPGNIILFLAVLLIVLGGVFVFSEMMGGRWQWTEDLIKFVEQNVPKQ